MLPLEELKGYTISVLFFTTACESKSRNKVSFSKMSKG